MHGDLSTLCWMQSRISFVNNDDKENLIRVVYASINFRDIMIASGKLREYIADASNNSSLIGMEFVGFNKNGQRIMGMCASGYDSDTHF